MVQHRQGLIWSRGPDLFAGRHGIDRSRRLTSASPAAVSEVILCLVGPRNTRPCPEPHSGLILRLAKLHTFFRNGTPELRKGNNYLCQNT
jgi:hypothetical protein